MKFRRTVSMNPRTYLMLRKASEVTGTPMAALAEHAIRKECLRHMDAWEVTEGDIAAWKAAERTRLTTVSGVE